MKSRLKVAALAMVIVGVIGVALLVFVRWPDEPKVNWLHRLAETNPEGRRKIELLFDEDGNERRGAYGDLRERLDQASDAERQELLDYLAGLLRDGDGYVSQFAGFALTLYFGHESRWEYLTPPVAQAMADTMVRLDWADLVLHLQSEDWFDRPETARRRTSWAVQFTFHTPFPSGDTHVAYGAIYGWRVKEAALFLDGVEIKRDSFMPGEAGFLAVDLYERLRPENREAREEHDLVVELVLSAPNDIVVTFRQEEKVIVAPLRH